MSRRQQSLFDTQPPSWELDDESLQTVAMVVFPEAPVGEFDYAVPDKFREASRPDHLLEAGRRVRVPLGRGNRSVVGYCVAIESKSVSRTRLKTVAEVLDRQALLSPAMLRLTRWMADYYLCSWGQVLEAVVPAGVRHQSGTRQVMLLSVPTQVAARVTQLDLPPKQAEALRLLAASKKPLTARQLAGRAGCTLGPVNALRKRGLVEETVERVDTQEATAEVGSSRYENGVTLTDHQQHALKAILGTIRSQQHQTILVHGVTGSGKTEVYIQAIEEIVSYGQQAIVLVPEISLTPQTVARFRARFDSVAILHSHQSDAERHRHWQRIAAGAVQVVVGARSAVFAPTPQLGLIVIDEEHEPTFKQEVTPRYHARTIARRRAAADNVPLVLGSATPSLESWHLANTGSYQLVSMPRRVLARPLPAVRTIDLRMEENRSWGRSSISRPLYQNMESALRDQGQVILLLNRRGFSTHIQCPACGKVVECPHCAMSLTFHRQRNAVMCHYCDYETTAPLECPDCHSSSIRFSGSGTQKLEAEVQARFPDHRCVRMDSDSMRRPGSHQQALDTFRRGDARILLGTQMIAKGLDFPNVTLVGVINADTALHLPDFRAAERTFQLVTQVAGRTGRGEKGGRVVVQTCSSDHPAILAAVRHDYPGFAGGELPNRKAGLFPPYSSLVRMVVRGDEERSTQAAAEELGRKVDMLISTSEARMQMLGPAVAPMAKLRGSYRFHLLLQAENGKALRSLAKQATESLTLPNSIHISVDVDPIDMM